MPDLTQLESEKISTYIDNGNIFKRFKNIKDFPGIKINSGLTGFQATEAKRIITDGNTTSNGIRFVVSGTIDPYVIKDISVPYMKDKYQNPFINFDKDILSTGKWNFYNSSKIIIAGMTRRLEATYCSTPIALGVGIYGIYEFGDFVPQFLLGLLNSKFYSHYLNIEFKDKHLAGGYLAINKSTILGLPLEFFGLDQQSQIVELVNKILDITKKEDYLEREDLKKQVQILERKIDEMVYELYELTPEEIEIVESATS